MRWIEVSMGLQIKSYSQCIVFIFGSRLKPMLSDLFDGYDLKSLPQQLPRGFFSLSSPEFGPFFETSISACAAGSWDRCHWLSLTTGFQRALRELEEEAVREVSEGFNTGPLGGSPVQDRVVGGPEEKKRGWVGRRGVKLSVRRSEMKQIKEFFFGEHVSCTAAVLEPAGDASGFRSRHSTAQSKRGSEQDGRKAKIMWCRVE